MSFMYRIRRSLSRPFALPLGRSRAYFVLAFLTTALRRAKVSLGLYGPLTRLATKYKTDKGVTTFPFHAYTLHYDKLFRDFRKREINLLEIGLARCAMREDTPVGAPSISMWLDYFPKAHVYGFDIDDFSFVKLPRARIFCGDQGNVEDLLKVVEECSKFDIIIDDGSHASWHQQLTLKTLFPYLASEGLYIIEDIHYQPPSLESSLPPSVKMKHLLQDRAALNELITGVKDVHLYRSPIEIENSEDMGELGVIAKQ